MGALLRLPLRLIPPDAVLPILQGRFRGCRWVVGAGNHGCWAGSYERRMRLAFERELRPGGTVVDVGAHAGYYTLLASILVGPSGRVLAIEPLPRNLDYLRRHIALNRLGNVTVIEAAVARVSGEARFSEASNSYEGRLSPEGALRVRACSIDELVASGALPLPDLIKLDIEGGELEALEGARATLAAARPTLFLSTHSAGLHRACCDLLVAAGYALTPLDGPDLASSRVLLACAAPPSQDAHPR